MVPFQGDDTGFRPLGDSGGESTVRSLNGQARVSCLECAPVTKAAANAPFSVLPAAHSRKPERSADRLAPADATRRDDPPVECRDLFVAAAGPARLEEGRADCPRGAGPDWRPGNPDANDTAGRALA